jgi:hypothetical protein
MKPTFITLSDVHHGAIPHERLHSEFYSDGGFFSVLDAVVSEPEFIGVAITGDWWDHKLSLNDPRTKLGMSIIIDIKNRCQLHGKHFIILRGTYSHDMKQLDFAKEFEVGYDKFRLFNTVEEYDFGGLKTLILPEEYPKDVEEFYAPFFAKKYDLILGHGFFDFNCFDANEGEKSIPTMPIFDAEEICAIAPVTIFGHDHTHRNYQGEKSKGQIWYNGSFTRWHHGDETPKGFLYTEWDKKSPTINFIENELAPTFVTVVLDVIMEKVKVVDFESIVKRVESYRSKHNIGELKIKVTHKFIDGYRTEIELAKNYFANREGFRFESGRVSIAKRNEDVTELHGDVVEDRINAEDTQYGFLFGNDTIVDKISQFLTLRHNGTVELSKEDIAKALAPA